MKRILSILVLLCCIGIATPCCAQDYSNPKYLAGAVTTDNGYVVFKETFNEAGKSKADIYAALLDYTKSLLKDETAGPQCRITEMSEDTGIVAASMENTLTFKKTNWILDTARCFFQLVFEAKDGEYTATIRRIHYLYSPMDINGIDNTMAAEDWIVDKEALNKKGQLNKVGGKKFRYATINMKDAIFSGADKAIKK